MKLKAGIFGYPISHSISPAMHQAAFDHARIDASYTAWETHPSALADGISRLRGEEYLGANVTVPHKRAAMAWLDEIDDLANRIGAVNTIVNVGGRLRGANTDAHGFLSSLQSEAGVEPAGMNAVLIGAGGAARAAAHGLAQEGVGALTIANRTPERAVSLAAEIAGRGVDARGVGLSDPDFGRACACADLLVNSSSVGMLHGPAEGKSPVPKGSIGRGCVVYDMVYNPPLTPLLALAAASGAQTVGGLPMLVHQGAAAWTMWTGIEAPIDVMFEAVNQWRKRGNQPLS